MNDIVQNIIAPTLLPEVPRHLHPFVNTIDATDISEFPSGSR